MKSITVDEYKTRIPSGNSEYFDELDKEAQESYIALYNAYSSLVTDYFIKNCRLKEYDEALLESPYSFPKLKEEEMDIYQYLASDKLSFVYLRNNLYIERLTEEEQQFLIEKAQDDEIVYDDKTDEFVKATFKKVMLENGGEEDSVNVFYGPDNGNFMYPNNAVIVGIRYDDYYQKPGQSSEEWFDENNNRLQDVETLSIILETRMPKLAGVDCYAVKYNEFSVKKKASVDEGDKNKVM